MKNNNKKKYFDFTIKVILLTVIIILLFQNCPIPLIEKNNNKTGNNDTYEIKCNNGECVTLNEDLEESDLEVFDNDIKWDSTNKLNIFKNPVYNTNNKIAPEQSNIYEFHIKNSTNSKVKYNIIFNEENPYNINLKYKLKKDNKYIVDEWTDIKELNMNDITLNKSKSNIYYLEWKWFSGDNDNEISNIDDAYTATIRIDAEV